MTGDFPIDDSTAATAHNLVEFTVSELAGAIKRTLEGSFGRVRLRAEVSRPNYHTSGHLYLTLKDENAVIDGVCWRGTVERLGMRVEEGMEVICTGRISSYPRSSKYQLVIDAIELAGEGALLKLLEDRKNKLAAQGLFDVASKQPIPFLPDVIGVVTSPTGAVIRDILHRLADRFPRHVLLWPVPVQGEGAAEKIAAAIEGFNQIQPGGRVPRPDLLIVARGGGSLEDLWAFNEEVVVRAAANSEIPLISAVGHETDTTLIDFASDRRAPTPTAAAEMAVPVRAELYAQLQDCGGRLTACAARAVAERRLRVEGLARGLPEPTRLLEQAMQRLDSETDRLANAMRGFLAERAGEIRHLAASIPHPRQALTAKLDRLGQLSARLDQGLRTLVAHRAGRFDALDSARRSAACLHRAVTDAARHLASQAQLLESLSYRNVLKRGYVVARDVSGGAVTAAAATAPGMRLALEFHDGTVAATVVGGPDTPAPVAEPEKPKPKERKDGRQGSLL